MEYQVYTMTVGSGEESNSWRVITCKHDHSPVTEGLCKGGFLYYGADESNSDKSVVVSFNVSSEEFSVIELPEEVKIDHRWRLVNYNGEVALVDDSEFDFGIVKEPNGNGVFELWVRNETDGTWWRNCIEIPHWEQHVGNMEFFFKGTIGTGELVFAQDSVIERSFYVVYYDTVTQNLRTFTIEGVARDQLHDVRTFLDHVDSTWLM
ncbi:putative F-box associated interaction domain-containing protein [Arabidopsis thaliana]